MLQHLGITTINGRIPIMFTVRNCFYSRWR